MQKPVTPADFYNDGNGENMNKPLEIPKEKTAPQEDNYDPDEADRE